MKNITRTLARNLALGAVLLTPLALSVPALAADAQRVEVVKFNDLDLADPADVKAPYGRLQAASRRVCRDPMSFSGLPGAIERSACIKQALEMAVQHVNKPRLTALHEGKPAADLRVSR